MKLILAYSPQAKERVERRHAVFQDRLIKAMRLADISDLAGANQFLEQSFLPELTNASGWSRKLRTTCIVAFRRH